MSYTEVAHDYLWGKDVGMGFTFDARGDMLAAISIHVREEGDSNTQGDMVADAMLSRQGDIIVGYHKNEAERDKQVQEHLKAAQTELQHMWDCYQKKQRGTSDYVKYLGCTAELEIPGSVMKQINGYLHAASEDEYQSEDHTITYTVQFPDGKEMDIKCCGTQDGPSWTEAVLFDEYGNQLCCTEPDYSFDGPWELQYEDTLYTVNIKTDPT